MHILIRNNNSQRYSTESDKYFIVSLFHSQLPIHNMVLSEERTCILLSIPGIFEWTVYLSQIDIPSVLAHLRMYRMVLEPRQLSSTEPLRMPMFLYIYILARLLTNNEECNLVSGDKISLLYFDHGMLRRFTRSKPHCHLVQYNNSILTVRSVFLNRLPDTD